MRCGALDVLLMNQRHVGRMKVIWTRRSGKESVKQTDLMCMGSVQGLHCVGKA